MGKKDIPYYQDYISDDLLGFLKGEMQPVMGVPGLGQVGLGGGLETKESLSFLCDLYRSLKVQLNAVLNQRIQDREFFDQRTRACFELNQSVKVDFLDPIYTTVIGQEDSRGRIVVGPKNGYYCRAGGGKPIAPIPEYLQGHHITLFGPPDDAKLSINAMNSYHRKIKGEPEIVSELLSTHTSVPKWGADDEDSKTPLRKDLISAGENLTHCFAGDLSYTDPRTQKQYNLESDHLALPIKRFPGLALPSLFLFLEDNPLPLHLYDFALHFFKNWRNPKALSFYVPKLENEEEARYIRVMLENAERMIKEKNPEYKLGSIRLFIVLENPRAIFRVNEIMDELYPYFAGASLGWHDYLASTARLFKEDANYRIPVKADPDIVIKYIKASHDLLANVVGPRGGIKIGGMYGILPMDNDFQNPSFQLTLKGFIKDVITQMKRNLSGFWVAHPDFVRLGLALTEGWKFYLQGDKAKLDTLVTSLLQKQHHKEILEFIHGPDLVGLDLDDPLYPRSLIVADLKESGGVSGKGISNSDPEEIRYNVFQSLQYLTDWLTGNGCVALPAQIEGVSVRVMDDLATAERSRWEVWHEIHHGRFSLEAFLQIAHEEMLFIRKDLSNEKKIVQVKWDERTEKWYPIAFQLMIQLMTSKNPPEFAPELLLPFTIESIRSSKDPMKELQVKDPGKYVIDPYIERYNQYFLICGSPKFAKAMACLPVEDLSHVEDLFLTMDLNDVKQAARFHGDIGEGKKTLDAVAALEQKLVQSGASSTQSQLRELGAQYLTKHGVKFLISAQGKSGQEILLQLQTRLLNNSQQEFANAKEALKEITKKRLLGMTPETPNDLSEKILGSLKKHKVVGASLSISVSNEIKQTLCLGEAIKNTAKVTKLTEFEIASLSKAIASCFAIEYFRKREIDLDKSVNSILETTSSTFRIKSLSGEHPQWADQVTIRHLMNHTALNMHYVNGIPASHPMPAAAELLNGNKTYGYEPVGVINAPGTKFQYSGGGFLVLQHLIESLEKKDICELTAPFLKSLGLQHLSFIQKSNANTASGYLADGAAVEDSRKMFPAFAAGALGTSADMALFLEKLTSAYHSLKGDGPISHDTAVQMLFGTNLSSRQFMGADMGLGIFTIEAGTNRMAVHQGANDGYRSLFLHCYDGPDRGKGMVILCNGDSNSVLFIAEVAQAILTELKISGINQNLFKGEFDSSRVPLAELVNRGYKDLIFNAFQNDLPEPISREQSRVDPLAAFNLAVGGIIQDVSNQRFARAENLLSDRLPTFDPELFGRQGKIMDSWESSRHNEKRFDTLTFKLKKPSAIQFVSLSTQFHLGNQAQAAMIEGRQNESEPWRTIVAETQLDGHAMKYLKATSGDSVFSEIKVTMFPDGGLSRLGLYGEDLPLDQQTLFHDCKAAKSSVFKDPIPHAVRPLVPHYSATDSLIKRNWAAALKGSEVDLASAAFGGKISSASNEHYGPAAQIISPFPPLNMFDGFESARSRDKDHFEEVVIALGKQRRIHRIEIDFTYFKNNNPRKLSILGLAHGSWITLAKSTDVKAYAGNLIEFKIDRPEDFSQIKVVLFPDGGMNRVRVFSPID